jgi:hypothetical protein
MYSSQKDAALHKTAVNLSEIQNKKSLKPVQHHGEKNRKKNGRDVHTEALGSRFKSLSRIRICRIKQKNQQGKLTENPDDQFCWIQ